MPRLNLTLSTTLRNGSREFILHVPGDFDQKMKLTVRAASNPLNLSIDIRKGSLTDEESLSTLQTLLTHTERYENGTVELSWLMKGGSYVLTVKSLDHDPAPTTIELFVTIERLQFSGTEEAH